MRGTPQQIIEKYNQLARDAQLSNDRVAAENFQQHAEHYTRLLGAAQKEIEAQREQQEREQQERRDRQEAERLERAERAERNSERNGERNDNRSDRNDRRPRNDRNAPTDQPRVAAPGEGEQPDIVAQPVEAVAEAPAAPEDSGLVTTPEESPKPKRARAPRKPRAPRAPKADASAEAPVEAKTEKAKVEKKKAAPKAEKPVESPTPAGDAPEVAD